VKPAQIIARWLRSIARQIDPPTPIIVRFHIDSKEVARAAARAAARRRGGY
jgi:hypothetical protein